MKLVLIFPLACKPHFSWIWESNLLFAPLSRPIFSLSNKFLYKPSKIKGGISRKKGAQAVPWDVKEIWPTKRWSYHKGRGQKRPTQACMIFASPRFHFISTRLWLPETFLLRQKASECVLWGEGINLRLLREITTSHDTILVSSLFLSLSPPFVPSLPFAFSYCFLLFACLL